MNTRSLRSLPPKLRAAGYEQLAKDAFRMAFDARNKKARTEFLALAENWHSMAEELDYLIRISARAQSDDVRHRNG